MGKTESPISLSTIKEKVSAYFYTENSVYNLNFFCKIGKDNLVADVNELK